MKGKFHYHKKFALFLTPFKYSVKKEKIEEIKNCIAATKK